MKEAALESKTSKQKKRTLKLPKTNKDWKPTSTQPKPKILQKFNCYDSIKIFSELFLMLT